MRCIKMHSLVILFALTAATLDWFPPSDEYARDQEAIEYIIDDLFAEGCVSDKKEIYMKPVCLQLLFEASAIRVKWDADLPR